MATEPDVALRELEAELDRLETELALALEDRRSEEYVKTLREQIVRVKGRFNRGCN
jgi:hypothetical protein